ncbi:MAG TPA: carboxymuconolactone decarboxylase family protein [Kofleriaceae bacterium]|nr:carboxymuconolactone decarboxylase family protein [Kofleriaceae bacterium]
MSALDLIRASLPPEAVDIKLNLGSVLSGGPLTRAQRWGVALAAAAAARSARLRDAIAAEARRELSGDADKVIEDALAAAVLMGMNNVYYRFRHMIGKPSYSERPARLRMNRLVKPAASKLDFELFSLAVSSIAGCESCVRAHEQAVLEGGLSEEHVHDAVRIAAVINAAAVALELSAPAAAEAATASMAGS